MSEENSRYSGPNVRVAANVSPYPISRMSAVHDLVDVALEIQKADAVIAAVASEKLGLIAEQMRMLQEQSRDVLARAQRDTDLHRAECRFQKVAGQMYHLYRKDRDGSGMQYFSMLSPADWRDAPPDVFLGTFRLEADATFTPLEEVVQRDNRAKAGHKLLGG
jgi:hypothetical protein